MTRGRRREHYQWNMDIWGVTGVAAEAELLGAMVAFFERVGLGPEDVGIKVNSRGVLTEVLRSLGVPEEKHTATCVLVDKLDKVGRLGAIFFVGLVLWKSLAGCVFRGRLRHVSRGGM